MAMSGPVVSKEKRGLLMESVLLAWEFGRNSDGYYDALRAYYAALCSVPFEELDQMEKDNHAIIKKELERQG